MAGSGQMQLPDATIHEDLLLGESRPYCPGGYER